jgi:hypothetical protein
MGMKHQLGFPLDHKRSDNPDCEAKYKPDTIIASYAAGRENPWTDKKELKPLSAEK